MRKAVAYIDHRAILELLKIPHGIKMVNMEYPARDNRVKITFEGDTLPVKRSGPKTKRLPEVKYTIVRHWHNAKIEPRTKESDNGDKQED